MRILCTSDLHGEYDLGEIPEADVMVFAGDLTAMGTLEEVGTFNAQLVNYPAPVKIVVAGNHDWAFYDFETEAQARSIITNGIYLQDESVLIDGILFYGSQWTPQYFNWAFMLPRGDLHPKWDLIDQATTVLVTHGPPAGKCDHNGSAYQGCSELRQAVERVRPKFHIFGHVHMGYGACFNEHTTFINAARCNAGYFPVNAPVLIEL